MDGGAARRTLRLERSPFEPPVLVRLVAAGLALTALGWLLGLPLADEPPAFDVRLVELAAAPTDTTTFAIVAAIGRVGHLVVVSTLAVGVALFARWRSGWWDLTLLLATVLGGATVMTGVLKLVFERARPDESLTVTAAFPSGHAVRGAAVLGLIGWVVRVWSRHPWVRALAIPVAVLLVAVNGAARVVLGVHWPTDILAGFLLGGAWLLVACALLRPHAVERTPQRDAVT